MHNSTFDPASAADRKPQTGKTRSAAVVWGKRAATAEKLNAVPSENVLPATLFPRSGKDKQETLLRRSVVSDFVTHPSRNTGIELFLLCIFFLFLLFFHLASYITRSCSFKEETGTRTRSRGMSRKQFALSIQVRPMADLNVIIFE